MDINVSRKWAGLHALLTMAFACKEVDLYGFSGSTTIDGHPITDEYGIEFEHAAIAMLIDRTLPRYDYPDEATRLAWSRTTVRYADL